jgi:ferredoxin-NADP reductase
VLPDPADAAPEGLRHAFSIVSAPHESELVVATRMRSSPFKDALASLAIGAPAAIDGPFGSLTLHKNPERPALFIAGGIGITPFISMLRHAVDAGLQHKVVLLYSNRRPQDSAFIAELQDLEAKNAKFRLVATMTDMAGSRDAWTGETRRIEEAFLHEVGAQLVNPVHYVVGPPAMVGAVRDALEESGADADDIRSEEFYGY